MLSEQDKILDLPAQEEIVGCLDIPIINHNDLPNIDFEDETDEILYDMMLFEEILSIPPDVVEETLIELIELF